MKRIIVAAMLCFIMVFAAACSKDDVKQGKTDISSGDGVNTQGEAKPLLNKKILVDAGHGKANYKLKEPNAPGSDKMKAANVAGTSGKNQTEAELNLKVAKLVEQKLKALGADVYMTRTDENSTLSNVGRAEFGNRLGVDIVVRVHANGSDNKEVHGILTMIPTNDYINDSEMVAKSQEAGTIIQKHMIATTEAKDMGMEKHSDLTGFNWSKVPVVLVEMGFMTNPDEDKLLELPEYQEKIANGIVNGLVEYYN